MCAIPALTTGLSEQIKLLAHSKFFYFATPWNFLSESNSLFFPTEEWTDPLIDMLSILFNSADDGQMQEHHLLQLLSGIIQWIDPPDAVSQAIEDGKSERSYS